MSVAEPFLPCLICHEKLPVKDMLQHIHTHIKYFPQKCKDCNFWCINQNEFNQHTFTHSHEGDQLHDAYKHYLVDLINSDTMYAAKHGTKAMLKSKNIVPALIPSTPTSSSTVRTPPSAQQQSHRPPPPVVVHRLPALPPLSSSSSETEESSGDDDEESPPRAAVKKTPPVVAAKRSDARPAEPARKQQRKNSDDGESDDNAEKNIEKLRQKLSRNVTKCNLCKGNRLIPIALISRQKHIRDKHMADVQWGTAGYQMQLEARTKEAFPFLEWNCRQCSKCSKFNELHNTRSRKGHLITYHSEYFKPLFCPWKCGFKSIDPNMLSKHFQETHGALKNWRLSVPNSTFSGELAVHNSKLEAVAKLFFTVELPFAPNSDKKKKRKSEDNEDEEDVQEFVAAALANAPKRSSAAKPTPKRHRSKSTEESSSEEEASSDDDEKAASSQKGKTAVVTNAGGGTKTRPTVVDLLDTDAEDEQMDVDDKEEAKSDDGSSWSTAATVGNASQEDKKRESSPDVKAEQDIKEVPVTPNTRVANTRVGPLAAFPAQMVTARRLLAVSGAMPNVFTYGRGEAGYKGRGGQQGPVRGPSGYSVRPFRGSGEHRHY